MNIENPIDSLKESAKEIKEDVKELIRNYNKIAVDVAKLQGQIKVIYIILSAFISGVVLYFFQIKQ